MGIYITVGLYILSIDSSRGPTVIYTLDINTERGTLLERHSCFVVMYDVGLDKWHLLVTRLTKTY